MLEHKNVPADFNDRIHAFAIDYGSVLLVMLIAVFMQFKTENDPMIKLGIVIVAWYFINVFPVHIKKGSSIGRKNSDIIVKRKDLTEVTTLQMYGRQTFIFVMIVVSGGLYIPLSFFLLDSRLDKRSIHDLIFSTKVVKKTPVITN